MSEFRVISGRKIPAFWFRGHRAVNPTVVTDGGDVGVLIIFKCASRSMVAATAKRTSGRRNNLPREIHVFVRDPIERLRSAYRFFQRRPPIMDSYEVDYTWERFIDLVLAGAKNLHWRPVTETIEAVGKPVIAHRFENLRTEWPLDTKLPHINASTGGGNINTDYRRSELEAMYAGDYALRGETV